MTLLAGLDFGTSSVKLTVVDADGRIVARGQAAYPTRTGSVPGAVEQDPEDWWSAACAVLAGTGVAHDVDVLGLTGQMQDVIAVAGDRPVRPALLYSDTRAGRQHERLVRELPDWERRTGNHQDVSNLVAKLAWLTEHEPAALATADRLLFSAHGYVGVRAGGRAACDLTTASTTGLLDVDERRWFADAVAAAGIDPELLPALGGGQIGQVSADAAAELGVRSGIPVVLAMGDAGSTTDGLVGSSPGDAYLYLGTTGWLAAITAGAPDEVSAIHSLVMPGWTNRLRIGAVQSAGSAAAWARDVFLPGREFAEVDAVAAGRVDRLDVRPLCLPGLTGERAPVRDGAFRGAFVGVHDATTPIDLYLSVLTGVAFGLRHAADALGITQDRLALVGGGGASPVWRQILADVFDATIVTGRADDPGCRSAAIAAAQALGIPHRLAPLLAPGAAVTRTRPSAATTAYAMQREVHRGLYDALGSTFHRLSDLDGA